MGHSERTNGSEGGGDSAARRLAREVSALQADLLGKLHEELSGRDPASFATAAQELARDFGSVTATAVGALWDGGAQGAPSPQAEPEAPVPPVPLRPVPPTRDEPHVNLHSHGEMRRRLDQLIECNKRYGQPFGLVVFDVDGPGARNGQGGSGQQAALAMVAAALHDSVRIVDEAFQVEDDGICVFAPHQTTVEGVGMAERLLRILNAVEASGGLRIGVTAGVVACPEHGVDAEGLLQKADEAMWRARAVGQPVGVGPLESLQDR